MGIRSGPASLCLVAWLAFANTAWADSEGRVIVRFRENTARTDRSILAASDRVLPLAQRAGLTLGGQLGPSPDTMVVRAQGLDSQALAARLASDADVEYAVPDQRRHILALPSDPLYPQQWYLQDGEPTAVRANLGWDLATGDPSAVVAVLDTGVRFDHEDLAAVLLPGYDFISDAKIANDGDGRDSDPSDPGDYITQADINSGDFDCTSVPQASSWHGTRISGVVAAAGNNARGVAGLMWNGRVLPLRVIGKCGGYDSDILAAIRWAAGLEVPGVPANPHPAKVINLSLGGEGSCPPTYRDTIAAVDALGVLVVAAAGNARDNLVEAPANCPGVLAVGGLRNTGVKVGYSSMGPEIGISAPAGNCGSLGTCLYPINSTTNLGTTVPAANGYTDATDPNLGTSFSAAIVSGMAGLMSSLNPALGRTQLFDRLQASATPFPVDPSLPTCPTLGAVGTLQEGQCNCTTATCGAGMANAFGALQQAQRPVAAIAAASAPLGSPLLLDASASAALPGATVANWAWSVVSGPGSTTLDDPSAAKTYLRGDAVGTYRVRLMVTDSVGRSDSIEQDVTVTSTSTHSSSGGGGGGALGPWAAFGLLGLLFAARRNLRRSNSQ